MKSDDLPERPRTPLLPLAGETPRAILRATLDENRYSGLGSLIVDLEDFFSIVFMAGAHGAFEGSRISSFDTMHPIAAPGRAREKHYLSV